MSAYHDPAVGFADPPQRSSSLTPHDAEAEIRRLADRLDQKCVEFEHRAVEAAEAEAAYRLAHAKALLKVRGETVGEREARAVLETEGIYQERRRAEAVADACKESIRSLREQLAAARSVSASVRASMEM